MRAALFDRIAESDSVQKAAAIGVYNAEMDVSVKKLRALSFQSPQCS